MKSDGLMKSKSSGATGPTNSLLRAPLKSHAPPHGVAGGAQEHNRPQRQPDEDSVALPNSIRKTFSRPQKQPDEVRRPDEVKKFCRNRPHKQPDEVQTFQHNRPQRQPDEVQRFQHNRPQKQPLMKSDEVQRFQHNRPQKQPDEV